MIDTGMGRLGFPWATAGEDVPRVARLPGLAVCGISSHFASAASADAAFTQLQAERIQRVVVGCEARGLRGLFKHISNSGGIQMGSCWDMDGVRPGILLYGYGGLRGTSVTSAAGGLSRGAASGNGAATPPRASAPAGGLREVKTRPFLHWRSRVLQVKTMGAGQPISYDGTYVTREDTRIGTVDVGYADGYSRSLSNRGRVLIRGRRYPVAGRVTMNFLMVDLGRTSDVQEGDIVTLLGTDGAEAIHADEMAGWRDTIAYEVLTSIRTDDRRILSPGGAR
jgi:alanine racemase